MDFMNSDLVIEEIECDGPLDLTGDEDVEVLSEADLVCTEIVDGNDHCEEIVVDEESSTSTDANKSLRCNTNESKYAEECPPSANPPVRVIQLSMPGSSNFEKLSTLSSTQQNPLVRNPSSAKPLNLASKCISVEKALELGMITKEQYEAFVAKVFTKHPPVPKSPIRQPLRTLYLPRPNFVLKRGVGQSTKVVLPSPVVRSQVHASLYNNFIPAIAQMPRFRQIYTNIGRATIQPRTIVRLDALSNSNFIEITTPLATARQPSTSSQPSNVQSTSQPASKENSLSFNITHSPGVQSSSNQLVTEEDGDESLSADVTMEHIEISGTRSSEVISDNNINVDNRVMNVDACTARLPIYNGLITEFTDIASADSIFQQKYGHSHDHRDKQKSEKKSIKKRRKSKQALLLNDFGDEVKPDVKNLAQAAQANERIQSISSQHNSNKNDNANPLPADAKRLNHREKPNDGEVDKNSAGKLMELSLIKQRKPCNCSRTKCLKLYCECFANGEFCNECNCTECHNNIENEKQRQVAIALILERNPIAFKPKVRKFVNTGQDGERRHVQGCKCKRSGCLKNYCECYEAKVPCSSNCRCQDCRNREGDMFSLHDKNEKKTDVDSTDVLNVEVQNITSKPCYVKDGKPADLSNFVSTEITDATCNLLLVKANDLENQEVFDQTEIEIALLEEFGKCLSQIIEAAANSTHAAADS